MLGLRRTALAGGVETVEAAAEGLDNSPPPTPPLPPALPPTTGAGSITLCILLANKATFEDG